VPKKVSKVLFFWLIRNTAGHWTYTFLKLRDIKLFQQIQIYWFWYFKFWILAVLRKPIMIKWNKFEVFAVVCIVQYIIFIENKYFLFPTAGILLYCVFFCQLLPWRTSLCSFVVIGSTVPFNLQKSDVRLVWILTWVQVTVEELPYSLVNLFE